MLRQNCRAQWRQPRNHPFLAEEGEDEDEKAMVGKLALVNEAKKYLAEENGREATVQELAAYTQLTEEELSDILLLIQKADQKDK